ncbi:hypothetical protein Val02_01950 [Virgisporangium aliadipatigenens]|uniref:DUF742 domain-containing protein n=1 Tax=Virgisporangium aliadipatigenens TaxID=741659 RepID=A0A8J3YDY5_9ACTN|nr:DUF742 domain-containing protein [Virgisporangium aliadipatigenens]GIJ43309.1 hypothetical protein Val02_01950 [Virgisporangium aliadipatigenens]
MTDAFRVPDARMLDDPGLVPGSRAGRHRPGDDRPEPPEDDLVVRPFLMTGGRTRPLVDGLYPETMLSVIPAALSAPLRFELRRIAEYCRTPRSVAEIAVRLKAPLGVAKVLVGDLVTGGHLTVLERTELTIDVIERIRDRVRAL